MSEWPVAKPNSLVIVSNSLVAVFESPISAKRGHTAAFAPRPRFAMANMPGFWPGRR